MKFRMLILAAAALAFASLSFGQSTWEFDWHDAIGGQNPENGEDWQPLLYNCAAPHDPVTNPVLFDGTVVRIMKDITPAAISLTTYNNIMNNYSLTYDPGDVPYEVGEDGNSYQIMPTNEFVFNSAEITGASLGSFVTPLFEFRQGTPPITPNGGPAPNTVGQRMYLLIGCYDEFGEFQPMYNTRTYTQVALGYSEVKLHSYPEYGPEYDAWLCVGSCPPPVTEVCEDNMTESPFTIPAVSGGHGDINDPEPNEYWCVELCEGTSLELKIGPLRADEEPIINVLAGCASNGCNVECEAATFVPLGAWAYDAGTMMFSNVIVPLTDGCACIELEDILPVDMGSISITPRDAAVELTWNTLAETGLDYFKVMRNGELRATVNATAEAGQGANYSYTDEARNGVTYSYSLVAVESNGSETVLRETEATPNASLAVITEYALHQNYPNPFNPTTSIVFDVVESNHVTLTVYNAMGQEVSTLVNGTFGNGRHNVEFSSDNLTSGLYFYSVKIGNEFTATKKMLLVK